MIVMIDSVVIIHMYDAHYIIVACNIYILNHYLHLFHILCRPALFFLEKGIKCFVFRYFSKQSLLLLLSAPE